MTTQRKLTRPGAHDNEWCTVTCTPEATAAEFFQMEHEAQDAARDNLHPTTSTFVTKVITQGQHAIRGTASHHAVLITVDDELRRALAIHLGISGRPKREAVAALLKRLLEEDLEAIRAGYRMDLDSEPTHPGVAKPPADTLEAEKWAQRMLMRQVEGGMLEIRNLKLQCHPGYKCANYPACESCGPARQ